MLHCIINKKNCHFGPLNRCTVHTLVHNSTRSQEYTPGSPTSCGTQFIGFLRPVAPVMQNLTTSSCCTGILCAEKSEMVSRSHKCCIDRFQGFLNIIEFNTSIINMIFLIYNSIRNSFNVIN